MQTPIGHPRLGAARIQRLLPSCAIIWPHCCKTNRWGGRIGVHNLQDRIAAGGQKIRG